MGWQDEATRRVAAVGPQATAPLAGEAMGSYRDRMRQGNAALWSALGCARRVADVDSTLQQVHGPHPVRLVFHRPRGARRPLPAVLTFCGGAFRQGGVSYPSVWALDRWRARAAEVCVVAIDYALAPEHPWPTALCQGMGALEWLWHHAERVGIDPDRLAVAGTSAGANLAAAVALANRDGAQIPLQLQLLEVPPLDLTWRHLDRSVLPAGSDGGRVVDELRAAARNYCPDARLRDPRVSPLLADSVAGLPASYLLAAEQDPLVGDARTFARRLDDAQVPVSLTIAAGQSHDSALAVGSSLAARHWQRSAATILASLHGEAR